MSNILTQNGTPWTTVVARGNKVKVPLPLQKMSKAGTREVFTSQVIYEDPATADLLRSAKVASIVNATLSPGAVIFSLPERLFDHHTDAYRLIVEQLGPVVGNIFNPLSRRGARSRGDLIISTKFREADITTKSITVGINVNGTQYKAVPFKDKSDLSHMNTINLTLYTSEEEEELVDKLMTSMGNYGKVIQIKKLTCRGFFEGEISVLLDRGSDNENYQELQRMLYLEAWDIFAPASFKGAQPVCYYCRQAGHVKRDCPSLQALTCFSCGGKGHTKRRCRDTDTPSYSEEIDSYLKLSQKEAKTPSMIEVDEQSEVQQNQEVEEDEEINFEMDTDENANNKDMSDEDLYAVIKCAVDEDETLPDVSQHQDTQEIPVSQFKSGSLHSRYAPIERRVTMDLDKSEDKKISGRQQTSKEVSPPNSFPTTLSSVSSQVMNSLNSKPTNATRLGHE